MMDESTLYGGTKIPICDNNRLEKDRVVFYPDELPEDHRMLSDVLRGVFAPFKVWRNCALEYHRQGFHEQFEQLLTEIVGALEDPDIDKLYQEQDKEDYAEGIIDIYVALASKALSNFCRAKLAPHTMPQSVAEYSKKVVDYLKIVDEKQRINEYTWLIRGFFEIVLGDLKRAEDHFRYVHDRAAKGVAMKRKYLFGSLVGLGVVSYAAQKYDAALGFLTKAVQTNPEASGAGVRTAVALCCFKLEQYDRAHLALEKSLALDPANASALVLMSLVEQATAKKDRVKRAQCHVRSYEYCLMANALEPGNPQTLNMLANHHFHTWRTLEFSQGGCFVVDRSHLMLPAQAVGDLIAPKNLLRLRAPDGSASVFTIIAIAAMPSEDAAAGAEEYVTVEVSPRIRPRFLLASGSPAPCAALDIKDLGSVERFAHQAMVRATLPAVLAESSYILGKVAHSLRDANLAFDFYWKALKDAPDMTLAAFGAAEILFSRKEFQASLELFEKVLMKSPEDKDTQAYVMYLKAIIRKELAPFDKLREIAPGFQHEADLWLLQGQLRQHDPEQHKHALRCFLNAKECMEQKMGADGDGKTAVSPAILSNIAVLHHSLGQLQKALEFSQLALLAVHAQSEGLASAHQHTPTVFRSAELEGVFYNWSAEAVCQVRVGAEAGHFVLAEGDAADLTALVAAGDEVVLSGVKHIVVRVVSPSEMFCSCPVKALATAEAATLGLRVKQPLNNFHDGSLTYSFNFARLLEDDGHTKAASEVYFELLKKHPSYMECYLRLSIISCDLGRFDEAAVWLSRALAVQANEAEAILCLGDLYSRSGNLEEAKKCYDKICSANRGDSKAMLSLGNFYFTYHGGAKADSQLKESYKFFYHVLNDNPHNAFAANGLGMVCAKKLELDAARETFSKAREANVAMSEDICTNLAHVYMMQHRSVEAERLYQATIRSLSRSGRSSADKPAYLSECVAGIQLKSGRFSEASRSVLRALHLDPTNLRCWYNSAFVGHAHANAVLAKASSPSAAIEDARMALQVAKKVFECLSMVHRAGKQFDRKHAAENSEFSSDKLHTLEQMLHAARSREFAQEIEKRRRDDDHNALLQSKSLQKELEAQTLESDKLAKQQLAEQREKKLQELREKWTANVVEKAPPRSKAGGAGKDGAAKDKKKRKKGSEDGDGDDAAGTDEGDDPDDALMRALSGRSDINFGSSDEDEAPAARREPIARASKRALNTDDLFPDSDEDEAPSQKESADGDADAPARKRLKKVSTAGDDSDDALDLADVDATSAAGAVEETRPRKQQRILDDDSD